MNKSETDIGDSDAGKTCSSKPDGHIKERHSQHFLANSACVGRVFLAAHLNLKLMNFRWLDWLCCLLCERAAGPAALCLRAGLCLSVCPSRRASPATPPEETCPQHEEGEAPSYEKRFRHQAGCCGQGQLLLDEASADAQVMARLQMATRPRCAAPPEESRCQTHSFLELDSKTERIQLHSYA